MFNGRLSIIGQQFVVYVCVIVSFVLLCGLLLNLKYIDNVDYLNLKTFRVNVLYKDK